MVKIRILSFEGDSTVNVGVTQATEQVNKALNENMLVIDETDEEKRIIKNATGITEESKIAIFPKVAGG